VAHKKKSKWTPKKKNSELGKNIYMRKKKAKKKIKTINHVNYPLGDSFIPSMKFQNGIFWMVQWWVLAHSSPQFQPIRKTLGRMINC